MPIAFIDQTRRALGDIQFQLAQIEAGLLPRYRDNIDTLVDLRRREREAKAILSRGLQDALISS